MKLRKIFWVYLEICILVNMSQRPSIILYKPPILNINPFRTKRIDSDRWKRAIFFFVAAAT